MIWFQCQEVPRFSQLVIYSPEHMPHQCHSWCCDHSNIAPASGRKLLDSAGRRVRCWLGMLAQVVDHRA